MLRLTLILVLVTLGTYYSLRVPFYALLFYLANAYFRPEEWVYSDIILSLHLSLAIGAYLVITTLLSKQQMVWNGRIILIVGFVLQSIVSTIVSTYAEYCWPYLLDFIKR